MPTQSATSIDSLIANRIEETISKHRMFAGIIGDRPSQYAKSPSLWNPTFKALGIDATYVAFDVVEPENLPKLISTLRETPTYIGGSVTVPYKIAVLPLLDDIEKKARLIGAVNTIVRTKEGKLIGYNTDGQGAVNALLKPLPGQTTSFLPSLTGLKTVLLGYGGAARAVAFFMAEALGPTGQLTIVGRDESKSADLAGRVQEAFGNARSAPESKLKDVLAGADLIINTSTKGQAGLRALTQGKTTSLEPYSALGRADAPGIDRPSVWTVEQFQLAWFPEALASIAVNRQESIDRLSATAPHAAFYDIIYAPLETEFLRQARWAGHRTLNGKGMNIWQAVDAFADKVMKTHLPSSSDNLEQKVFQAMGAAW